MATSQGRNAAQHKEGTKSRHAAGPVGQHPALEAQQADLEVLQRAIADPARARPGDILALQRVTGNRAVSGLLVQAKLVVGPVGDRYEQEADRVADQVLNMSVPDKAQRQEEEEEVQAKPETSTQIAASITPLVQKQEEEEELQTKPILQRQEEEEELQTKPLLQRQEEEEEVQAKPETSTQIAASITPLVQKQEEEEEL
ncbi:MAG TPA: hypothetical protein VLY63_02445, partial [Anaerolineae bacterium]|nr:hypothetical protein [Anaerolineae bacterium]